MIYRVHYRVVWPDGSYGNAVDTVTAPARHAVRAAVAQLICGCYTSLCVLAIEELPSKEESLQYCSPLCGDCTLYRRPGDVSACLAGMPGDWNGRCPYGTTCRLRGR